MTPDTVTGCDSPDDPRATEYYVLGGGRVGEAIAERLRANGSDAVVVDETHDPSESPGQRGDPADVRTLRAAGLSDEATAIVATRSDRRNLLIAQLVRAHFDVARVRVRVNDPDRSDLLAEAGSEPVCATSVLSDALVGDL